MQHIAAYPKQTWLVCAAFFAFSAFGLTIAVTSLVFMQGIPSDLSLVESNMTSSAAGANLNGSSMANSSRAEELAHGAGLPGFIAFLRRAPTPAASNTSWAEALQYEAASTGFVPACNESTPRLWILLASQLRGYVFRDNQVSLLRFFESTSLCWHVAIATTSEVCNAGKSCAMGNASLYKHFSSMRSADVLSTSLHVFSGRVSYAVVRKRPRTMVNPLPLFALAHYISKWAADAHGIKAAPWDLVLKSRPSTVFVYTFNPLPVTKLFGMDVNTIFASLTYTDDKDASITFKKDPIDLVWLTSWSVSERMMVELSRRLLHGCTSPALWTPRSGVLWHAKVIMHMVANLSVKALPPGFMYYDTRNYQSKPPYIINYNGMIYPRRFGGKVVNQNGIGNPINLCRLQQSHCTPATYGASAIPPIGELPLRVSLDLTSGPCLHWTKKSGLAFCRCGSCSPPNFYPLACNLKSNFQYEFMGDQEMGYFHKPHFR